MLYLLLMKTVIIFLCCIFWGAAQDFSFLLRLNDEEFRDKVAFKKLGRVRDDHGGTGVDFSMVDQLPSPAALISFYVYDKNPSLKSLTYYRYKPVDENIKLTLDGTSRIAWDIYTNSTNVLKEKFKRNNIELLTREDFLNTSNQISSYHNIRYHVSRLNQKKKQLLFNSIVGTGKKLSQVRAGYRYLPNHTYPLDTGLLKTYHKFNQALPCEAVVVISHLCSSFKHEVYMHGINLGLYASNPAPEDPQERYLFHAYNKFLCYSYATVYWREKIKIFSLKGTVFKGFYKNYDKVLSRFLEIFFSDLKHKLDNEK